MKYLYFIFYFQNPIIKIRQEDEDIFNLEEGATDDDLEEEEKIDLEEEDLETEIDTVEKALEEELSILEDIGSELINEEIEARMPLSMPEEVEEEEEEDEFNSLSPLIRQKKKKDIRIGIEEEDGEEKISQH